MDRDIFYSAIMLHAQIKKIEEQRSKLFNLKDEVVEILRGHTEIPEEEIYTLFRQIHKLMKYLDDDIDEKFEKLDKL